MSKGKEKIVAGLSDALGFAKGADVGARITIYHATEFYIDGIRFNAGTYEIRKIPDRTTSHNIGQRASFLRRNRDA